MGKKPHKDKNASRTINVEIAPGNQEKLDRYVRAYNHTPERTTPKVKYTDVVNEALDIFLSAHQRVPRVRAAAAKKK